MSLDLVSIVMPAFNSEKTIVESIKSIQNQSYTYWELLIVDDGSSDDTMKVIMSKIQDDHRIKLYQNTKKGVSSARNFGIDNAMGKYICFLDSDDLYSKDVIKNRLLFMKENNVKATTCEIVLTDKNLGDLGWVMKGKKVFTFQDFHGCPVHTNSVMFLKTVFDQLRFDEKFSNGEDWLMWQRIARMGVDFYFVKDCKIYYRQQAGAVRKNFLKHENSLLDVIDIVYGRDYDCPNPLPIYLNGLSNPDKKKVILKRRIGLFNYLLLEKKLKEANDIGQEILENTSVIKIEEIIPIVKYSAMRYYLCHENEHKDYIKTDEVLNKYYKKFFSPKIYKELEKYFFTVEEKNIMNYIKRIKGKLQDAYIKNT